MQQPNIRKYLFDIRESIGSIEEYLGGKILSNHLPKLKDDVDKLLK